MPTVSGFMQMLRQSATLRVSFGYWASTLAAFAMLSFQGPSVAYGQTTSTGDGYTPAAIQPGSPAGSYQLSGIDSVALYTGASNLKLPLLNIHGRGHAGYEMILPLERLWRISTVATDPDSPLYQAAAPGNAGQVFWSNVPLFSPGALFAREIVYPDFLSTSRCGSSYFYTQTLTRLTFVQADGTETDLVDTGSGGDVLTDYCNQEASRGQIFVSRDGSFLQFTSDAPILDNYYQASAGKTSQVVGGYLHFKDGTTYRIDNGQVSWIRDRNGNKASLSYSTSPYGVQSITDSEGRQINISYSASQYVITYPGAGNSTHPITINLGPLKPALDSSSSLQTPNELFDWDTASAEVQYNPQVFTSVVLPDGSQYSLLYNSYSEVSNVTLPTGGSIRYSRANAPFGLYGSPTRYLTERQTINADGSVDTDTQYTYSGLNDFSNPNSTTKVNHLSSSGASIAEEIHYFYGNGFAGEDALYGYEDWQSSKEYQTDYLTADQGTTLKSVVNTWTQRACQSSEVCLSSKYGATDNFNRENYQNDPIITKSVTTIVPTSLQKEVDYDFDPYYNNPMDEFDYDWGAAGHGPLLRHKATLYNTSSQYINAHILNLFDSGQIYDGNNTLLAQWDQQYDQATPDPESGIVGYDPSVTPLGNPTTKTNWLNTPTAQDLSTLLTYDIAGNVLKVQDPVGNVSKFSYSDSSNTYANVTEETNALSQVSTWAYDNNIDKPTSAIDPNKIETDYTYSSDPFDRVTAIQKAVGTTAASNINISYIGTTEVDIYSSLDSTSTDQALHTATRYDGFGRGSLNITYESSSSSIATTQNYDALGRLGTTTNPSRPGDGLGYPTSRQYDALGRPWSITTGDGAATCYSYADNQNPSCPAPSGSPAGEWMFVRDPFGKQKQMWTDGLGRLVMVIEDPGATPAHLNYVTTYTYDGLDDLISVSQGAVTRNFAYDSLKRLIAANNPENASAAFPAQLACPGAPTNTVWTTCYSYDNNGNLTTRQDNRNVVTTYKYDGLNRLVSKVYTGSAATPSSYFCYDGVYNSAENLICQNAPPAANAIGRLTETYNSNSTTQFTSFDPLGRVLKHSQTTGNYIYNFAYAYNFAGDLTCEQYPSGRLVLTSYDLANRVSQVTSGSGTCDKTPPAALPTYAGGPSSTQTIQYAPHGAPWLYVTGDTVWHARTYNPRLQVCGLQDVLAGTGTSWSAQACDSTPPVTGGTALLSATLNWGTSNNNGNLQGSSFTYAGTGLPAPLTFTQTYQYDNVNRLSSVNDASSSCGSASLCYSRSFGYDAFGNMYVPTNGWTTIQPASNMPSTASAYNSANQISDLTQTIVAYDAAGNQTKVNGNTLSYDAESRQAALAYAGATEDYLYDGDGKRVEKTGTGLSTTVFVYDALGRMAAEYSTATESSPCNTCYLSQDHLGTARMVTDQSGNVVARHDYLPFGEEIAANTAGRDSHWGSGNDPIKQKFTGKERDSESGLDYFGARYYGSALGRFTSVDPVFATASLFNPQSWNGYTYTLNNPLKYVDRDGNFPILAITGAVGAVVGGVAGAATEYYTQVATSGHITSGGRIWTAAGGGALAGGIAGLTLGIGTGAEAALAAGAVETGLVSASSTVIGDFAQHRANDALGLTNPGENETELQNTLVDAFTAGLGGTIAGKLTDKLIPIPNVRKEIELLNFASRRSTRAAQIGAASQRAQAVALGNASISNTVGTGLQQTFKAIWGGISSWWNQPTKSGPTDCVTAGDSASGSSFGSCSSSK